MIEKIFQRGWRIGRRAFLKSSMAATSMVIIGTRMTSTAYAEVKDYITSRIESVYNHDSKMRFRKSQDNPMVKKLYAEDLEHPMSEKSEHLLHAVYVDRSNGIDKIKNF